MLKPFPIALAVAFGLVATSCENEVELLDGSAPTPIVYGLYNQNAATQTLSLTKTFGFAEGAGAIESAATADSVYYDPESVTVTVTGPGGETVATRFSAADEGVVRGPGDFPGEPNFLYRFDTTGLGLGTGDDLMLEVTRVDDGAVIARAVTPRLPSIIFQVGRFPPSNYPLTATREQGFSWRITGDEEARDLVSILEVGFNIAYLETGPNGTEARELYFPAATNIRGDVRANIDLRSVYAFLEARLEADPQITRRFRYMQLVVTGGSESFENYQILLQANSGITSTQELPPFSNIEGGIGLYGSITQFRQDTFGTLTPGAFDALFGLDGDRFGVGDLNFEP